MIKIEKINKISLGIKIQQYIDNLIKSDVKKMYLMNSSIYIKINNKLSEWDIDFLYNILDENVLNIVDISEWEIVYKQLKQSDKDIFNLLLIISNNIWFLKLWKKDKIYEWALKEQWIIIILQNNIYINYIEFNKLIKNISNIPPFFNVKFNEFSIIE